MRKGGSKRTSSAAAIRTHELRERVSRLRCAGLTQQQIADQLGISQPQVSRHLTAALESTKEQIAGNVAALRAMAILEARAVKLGLGRAVFRGDPPSANVYLKALTFEANMLGLQLSQDPGKAAAVHSARELIDLLGKHLDADLMTQILDVIITNTPEAGSHKAA